MITLLLLADSIASIPRSAEAKDKFDLADAIPRMCRTAPRDGEIIVCARNDEKYRVRPNQQDGAFVEAPVKAALQISDTMRAAVEVESAPLPGGAVSKRAMVRLKIGL